MRYPRRNAPPINYPAIVPAVRNDGYWIATEIATSHKDFMDSPPVGLVRLVKLGVQVAAGLMCYMTFRVKGQNGVSVAYKAKVWIKVADLGHEIQSVEKVIGSERKTKIYFTRERMISEGNVECSSELANIEDSAKLLTQGYYAFVEKIRYANARKSASFKWRKFSDHEKAEFVVEAAKRLKTE